MVAKGDYRFDQVLVVPKILIAELCEPILLSVGPKAFTNVSVIDRISRWVVPTTKLAGKREVFLQLGTFGDERNGIE